VVSCLGPLHSPSPGRLWPPRQFFLSIGWQFSPDAWHCFRTFFAFAAVVFAHFPLITTVAVKHSSPKPASTDQRPLLPVSCALFLSN
jgi:hypothetical protein